MGETLSLPNIPEWMAREVAHYDLPITFSPATVLDIGANIGAFTLLAKKRWPQAVVHAYEPVEDNAAIFWQNCKDLKLVNLAVAAVRSMDSQQNIFLGDRGVTCSFHQLGRQTNNTRSVRVDDAIRLPSCEFVKIDTEGCEVEILGRLNLTQTKVLCVEYHFSADVDALTYIAEMAGMKLHTHTPLGDTWGLLIFARSGCIRENAPVTSTATKVFVALPVYGALDVFFTQSLIKMLNNPPCELMLRMNPGDSLVSRSRNTLTADFLESNATHLLFIDSDLIFSGDQIARLLSHDKDIVAGFYPKKQEGPVQWVCNGHLTEQPIGADGLQEVRYMGTGFILVKRGVFERMIQLYGDELKFKADHRERIEHDFWSVGTYQYPDGSRRYLSEDWFFCQRALDAGFKVWGDTRIVLKHVGQAIYPLKSQEAELFSGVKTSNGTPGADAIRPSSAPENPISLECAGTTALSDRVTCLPVNNHQLSTR